jgi:hypothetical protein
VLRQAAARGLRARLQTVPAAVAERLGLAGAAAALLVRPDQHVCARWSHATPERLVAALSRATGGTA